MRRQAGQTLIEVLIGLTAAALVMTAIATATLSSLSNSDFIRNQNLATNYAQQGMEIIKNFHKINYGNFSQLDGTYCFADTCNEIDVNNTGSSCGKISINCSPVLNVNSHFNRTIVVHTNDSESAKCADAGITTNVKVDVIVAWNDQKCTDRNNLYCHNVTVSSCFSDAEVVPTL